MDKRCFLGKYFSCSFILLNLVFSSLFSTAYADCSRPLKASIPQEWRPYFYRDEAENLAGLDIEILNRVFEIANCIYIPIQIPPRRGIEYIKSGKVDFVLAASITPQRKLYSYFSEAYRDEKMVLFVQAGMAQEYDLIGIEALLDQQLTIAVGNGAWVGEKIDQLRHNPLDRLEFIDTKNLATRLKLLVAGRVDAIIDDENSIYDTARLLGISDKIEHSGLLVNKSPQHFLFSKKVVSPNDISFINDAIIEFRKSDEYRAILKKYLGRP